MQTAATEASFNSGLHQTFAPQNIFNAKLLPAQSFV
jgi:hypothetical protein